MVTNRRATYLIVAALVGWSPLAVAAQDVSDTVKSLPGIEITTSVDSATVYIGDLITYSISITRDSSYQLVPPPLGANLGAFDVKDYQPDVESRLDDGRVKSETIFKLSTFTTGDYIIPPVPVTFILKDGSRRVLLAEAVPIKVQSLLLNTDDSVDIHANKPQHEFVRSYAAYYLWGGILLFLVAANLLIWWWIRKRKRAMESADRRAPWEVAFERLARLEQEGWPAEGKFKEYYFELTELAREYLGRMYSADVLEMTTEEFLEYFRIVELPAGMFDSCSGLLRHADLVKFAKYVPEAGRCHADFQAVRALVEEVRVDYERKRAAEIAAAQTPPAPIRVGGGVRG
jgi:hypothetical protein